MSDIENTEIEKNDDLQAAEECTEAQAEVHEIEDSETKILKELEDFKNKYYYLAAEMENMKKRHDRDLQNQIKFGSEKILKNLLEVVDNLERTMMAIEKDEEEKVKNIYTGIDMVAKQFLDVLKRNGLEQIEAMGKIFDPNFHEALAGQPAEGKENDEVIQVYQHGYSLNGRLIRAAKVVVAKN